MRDHLFTALGLAVITAALFAAYSTTLNNEFVYDDPLLIEDNPVVVAPSVPFTKAFSTPYFGAGGGGMGYYRPLMTLTFRIEYWLYRGEPFGFHLDNLLIHLGVCFAVFFLVIQLGASRVGGFLAGLVFAVHPVTTESVAWIAGRTDPFAFLLMCSALILLVRCVEAGKTSWWQYAVSVLLFLAAMLVKEVAAILALVISILVNTIPLKPGEKRRQRNGLAGGYFAVAIVLPILIVRLVPRDDPAELFRGRGDLWERGLTFLSVVPDYVGKIFWPSNLNLARPVHLVDSLGHLAVWGGAAVMGLALAVILWSVWKKKPLPALGASLFFFGLLAVSNLFPISYGLTEMDFPFFERYLYIPLAGFLITLASLVPRTRIKAVPLVVVLCLTPLMARATHQRGLQWRDNATLFLADVTDYPESHTLWFNVGQAFLEQGKYLEARSAFHKAHYLDPSLTMARVHEAVAVAGMKKFSEAFVLLEEIIKAHPENGQAYEALGFVQAEAGHYVGALKSYARAAALLNGSPVAVGGRNEAARRVKVEMETLFLEKKDYAGVLSRADGVLAVIPDCSWALEARGLALIELGREEEGVEALEAALGSGGEKPLRAMAKLIELYEAKGRSDEAEVLKQELRRIFGR